MEIYKFKEVKDEHSENIPLILLTLIILKLDKFQSFNDEQL